MLYFVCKGINVFKKKENKMTPGSEDRREFERLAIELPVKFMCLDSNIERQGTTSNISPVGIGLITGEYLKPDTSLELRLEIPNSGLPLYTRGSVVWSVKTEEAKYNIGILLEEVDLIGMSRILRAMHSQKN